MFYLKLEKLIGSPMAVEIGKGTLCNEQMEIFDYNVLLIAGSMVSLLGDNVPLSLGKLLTSHTRIRRTHLSAEGLEEEELTLGQRKVLGKVLEIPILLTLKADNASLHISDVFRFTELTDPDVPLIDYTAAPSCPMETLMLEMSYASSKPQSICITSGLEPGCCQLERDIGENKELVLKVMKYTLPPVTKEIKETGDIGDLAKVSPMFQYKVAEQPVGTSGALVSSCRFNGKECSHLFDRFYSTEGIGFSFNHDKFWNIFKSTPQNKVFFEEVFDKSEKEPDVFMNSGHGQAFSLELYIRMSDLQQSSTSLGNYVTIHSPFEIADFGGSYIELEPGWTYTFNVVPSLTETDSAALSLAAKDRNCLGDGDQHNLKAFRRYTQTACMFECHLKLATKVCNCTPWDYIMYDSFVPLCHKIKTEDCFKKILREVVDPHDCNCPSNCKTIEYDQSITIQKTKVDRLCMNEIASQR